MSNEQQEIRPGRFGTNAERHHLRRMFSQYSIEELRAVRGEINQLITEKLDSSLAQAEVHSRAACA